jgi:hypothetical protein
MRGNSALALLVGMSACGNQTSDQNASIRQVLTVACNVDGIVVPVAQPIVAPLGQPGAAAAGVDLLMHSAVVEACKRLSGVPVSVTGVSAPVTVPADTAVKPAN